MCQVTIEGFLPLSSEVDIVDQYHGHISVQVLHLICDPVLGFTGNESVDFSCSLSGFGEVDVEDLARVELFHILQELLQWSEARAQSHAVADIQLLTLLAVAKHVEKSLVRFVDLNLLMTAVAQAGEQLAVGFTNGPCRQH